MTLNISISPHIAIKIANKHKVVREEIEECFLNQSKQILTELRPEHKTNPPTFWFIANTDYGRQLKIVFIMRQHEVIEIKTAYEPSLNEVKIYEKHAKEFY